MPKYSKSNVLPFGARGSGNYALPCRIKANVTDAYLLSITESPSASEMKLVSFVKYDKHSGTMLHKL